ncbi:MAG: glycosyltransferase family 61 protein [Prolixibacteraceae bacterium]|nr:glycosyltransferase family 61 protein [Prolixibacteraceae bacterium]
MFDQLKEFLKNNLPENVKIVLIRIIILFNPNRWRYRDVFFFLNSNQVVRYIAHHLTSKQYELRDLITIDEAASQKIHNIDFLFIRMIPLHYYPPVFNRTEGDDEFMKEAGSFRNYGAVFKDVAIIGCSDLILLENATALYDLKENNLNGRYAYTDEAICYYKNNKCLLKEKISDQVIDKAISMVGNYSLNYYHLVIEILTKFKIINEIGIDTEIPILLDQRCLKIPQYVELIDVLNSQKRRIVTIDNGVRYKVSKLYYFSKLNLLPPNYTVGSEFKYCDTLFDLNSLKFLRSKLLPHRSGNKFPKRIFLTRKNASNRRQYNENEVFGVLKRYNFEEIIPENYSIADQIEIFHSAEIISGGSGAAFTNLIFCSKGCKAIIFTYNELPFSGFSSLARFVEVELVYITALEGYMNSNDIHHDFSINQQKLKEFMDQWIA